jgi:hypothetical protein
VSCGSSGRAGLEADATDVTHIARKRGFHGLALRRPEKCNRARALEMKQGAMTMQARLVTWMKLGMPLVLIALANIDCGGASHCFDCDVPDSSTEASAPDVEVAESGPDVVPIFSDASVPDAPSCTQLNVGILGTLGNATSSNFQVWLTKAGTSVTQIQTTSTAPPITSSTLASFDVIILSKLARDYTASEAAALATRVSNGKGLISLTGFMLDSYNPTFTNDLLFPFSVAYTGSLFDGPITVFDPHPITAGLTSVTFNGGYAISDLGGTGSTRTPIAFHSTTQPVGYAITLGAGRAFVWGDEWIEYDSEWSTNPQIKQLWVNIFAWLAPYGCPLAPQ